MDVGCIGGEGERTNGRKKREKFGEEAEEKAGDEAYQTEKNGKQSHRRMGTKFLRCFAPSLLPPTGLFSPLLYPPRPAPPMKPLMGKKQKSQVDGTRKERNENE